MENEGSNIKVGFGERSSGVGNQIKFIDDVWWPAVMLNNADTGLGRLEPHTSGTQAGSVT